MNILDPRFVALFSNISNAVREAVSITSIVPGVSHALSNISITIDNTVSDIQRLMIEDIVRGEGPNAKILKLVLDDAAPSYRFDNVLLGVSERPKLSEKKYQYLGLWLYLREIATAEQQNKKYLSREIELLSSQGNGSGLLTMTASIPSLEIKNLTISSNLEGLPSTKAWQGFPFSITKEHFKFVVDIMMFGQDQMVHYASLPDEFTLNFTDEKDQEFYATEAVVHLKGLDFTDSKAKDHRVVIRRDYSNNFSFHLSKGLLPAFTGYEKVTNEFEWSTLPFGLQFILSQGEFKANEEYVLTVTAHEEGMFHVTQEMIGK